MWYIITTKKNQPIIYLSDAQQKYLSISANSTYLSLSLRRSRSLLLLFP